MGKISGTPQLQPLLLAGDIGGTKTDLALFTAEGGPRTPLAEATFPSHHYTRLETIVEEFLAGTNTKVGRACFAIAGPVTGGRAAITNLTWVLDEAALGTAIGTAQVRLLNDLEALASAVPLLTSADFHTLNEGAPSSGGAIAVIAPGTGLGEAFLTWDGLRYVAHPSEGGHADFAPTNAGESALLQYLRQRFEHVSFERVCSGIGIPNIYDYLSVIEHGRELPELAAALAAAEDRTPLIIDAALHPSTPSPRCAAALDMFIDILGAESGNLALKVFATGGVYLGGGIPPRILPVLADGRLLQAFRRKGRFIDLLGRVPVHVITNTRAPLYGAARVGLSSTFTMHDREVV